MERTKRFIKNIWKYVLAYIIIFIVMTYEFPYYIDAPGGLIDIDSRFSIEGGYKSQGSLNLSYVTEYKATIPTIILSYILPDWDMYKKNDPDTNIDYDDMAVLDTLLTEQAYSDSVIVAYEKAGKEVEITKHSTFVYFVFEEADTDLRMGDLILSIEGESVGSVSDLEEILSKYNVGDTINIKVKRLNEEIDRTATLVEYDGRAILGIFPSELHEYKVNPSIKISHDSKESGPSGGLMLTLAIYNALTEEDITHGCTIVGTGEIDLDGNVGEIGGVKYKLKGISNKKVDLFFVPDGENYEEALNEKEKNNYKFDIVPVNHVDDALDYLKDYSCK